MLDNHGSLILLDNNEFLILLHNHAVLILFETHGFLILLDCSNLQFQHITVTAKIIKRIGNVISKTEQ